MSREVRVAGSVRVDLLGGTLDLNPINLILPNVVTLNLATSLKAKVKITEIDFNGVEIVSLDYNSSKKFLTSEFTAENFNNNHFGPLSFVAQILNLLGLTKGAKIELESGSPPGAGLGGSSAMGVTCFKAISEYVGRPFDRIEAIAKVNSIEAKILDCGPAGYQDYYPALFGGVLALHPRPGHVMVEQLFSEDLKNALEEHVTLVYSGETRLSGISNWEVYKGFFNKDKEIRRGLESIADLSFEAYQAIKKNKFDDLTRLIAAEGDERRKLFSGILTPSMQQLMNVLRECSSDFGMKVCGAGGGGCFLITHSSKNKADLEKIISEFNMKALPFNVEGPL